MCNAISRVEENLLDENHELYLQLLQNSPRWWAIVREDPELYIEVRKHNKIIIYYRGGRLAGVEYKSGHIEITAHPKYLGHSDKTDPHYYRANDHSAIYTPCEDWIINRLDDLKENIINNYTGDEDGQDTSEKLIQGKLIVNGRDKYLDSEFSHRFYDGQSLSVRIDLVKIENDKFVFEELKRIVDSRLWTRNGDPEIGTQMQNYTDFIAVNAEALASYYRILYKIKRRLGLPVPSVRDIDKVLVDSTPQLLIANNYDFISTRRRNRIQDIERYLDSKGISYSFIEER